MAEKLAFKMPASPAPAPPIGAAVGESMVISVPLEQIKTFPNHPFRVQMDADMQDLMESIRDHGIQEPVTLRAMDGYYQLLSGHRRCKAAQLVGLKEVPAIVKPTMDDYTATVWMVQANRRRSHLLPSELAKAYAMEMDALRHQGKKATNSTSETWSANQIAQDSGVSSRQVYRYIRLAKLIDPLLNMVDNKEQKIKADPSRQIFAMSMAVGLILADIPTKQQHLLYDCICQTGKVPSLSQAGSIQVATFYPGVSAKKISDILNEDRKKEKTACPIGSDKTDAALKNIEKQCVPSAEAVLCDTMSQSVQPTDKLKRLRNKQEREAFLDNYARWGIWKEIPELRVRFYKYDLPNGARIVAQTYVHPPISYLSYQKEEYTVAEFALLLPKGDEFRGQYGQEYTFYRPNGASKTAIIAYLTETKPMVADYD